MIFDYIEGLTTKEKMNSTIYFDHRRWHYLLLQYDILLS